MNTRISTAAVILDRPKDLKGQLIKYAICGGLSTVVMVSILAILNVKYPLYVSKTQHNPEVLAYHTNVFNTIAFIPATLVAYFTNRFLVFTPGRYHFLLEFFIFTLISIISYIGGYFGCEWIIEKIESSIQIGTIQITPSLMGSATFAVSSALINFVCRKFFIFRN